MPMLFVYGTLKRGYRNHSFLRTSTIISHFARVDGLRLHEGPGYPYAHSCAVDQSVYGELYDVSDVTLREIDRLEGHPHYYKRKLYSVHVKGSNAAKKAWVYVSQMHGKKNPVIPGGVYTEN